MRREYGQPRHFNPADPLDDLIFLVLSRMTQEVKYIRTYSRLRDSLSTWHAVRDAPPDELETLIHEAGLAPTKAAQIQAILGEIGARESRLSLHRLRGMETDKVEQYLTSLPGWHERPLCASCSTPSEGTSCPWTLMCGGWRNGWGSLPWASGARHEGVKCSSFQSLSARKSARVARFTGWPLSASSST